MINKIKNKLKLAFILPLSIASITTPFLLTSCSESIQENTSKPNPDEPSDQNKLNDPNNPSEPSDPSEPSKPSDPSKPNEPGEPEPPIQPTKPVYNGSIGFSNFGDTGNDVLNNYIFLELINDFVSSPEKSSIEQLFGNKNVVTFPASINFYNELTKGILFDSLKTSYFLNDEIKSISISHNSVFTITKPTTIDGGVTNGSLSIDIDIETTHKQSKSNLAPTNPVEISKMTLELTPYITVMEDVSWKIAELNILDKAYGNNSNKSDEDKKIEIINLYNEFNNNQIDGKGNSVLEQARKYHLINKGGLASYSVKLTSKSKLLKTSSNTTNVIKFIPLKMNGNYSYISHTK